MRIVRQVPFLAAAAMLSSTVTAFAPVARPVSQSLSTATATSSSRLQVLPSPADFHSIDMTAVNHVAQEFMASSSMVLSDAAAATAEADSGGWWQSYLQIFRNILVAVHDTVDGPLKNAGVENTWGISIALFTMGT